MADIGLKSQILSESAAFGGREGQVSAMSTIDKERLEGQVRETMEIWIKQEAGVSTRMQ